MNPRRVALGAWAIACVATVAAGVASAAGIRLNTTGSAPLGIWRVTSVDARKVDRGEIVSVCPPDVPVVEAMRDQGYVHVGNCAESGTVPFLKPVVAVAGDTVAISRVGVRVNGVSLPNSGAESGMPAYPAGTYIVAPGQAWFVSSYSPGSFDSRYFGPVAITRVLGRAAPILIRGDAAAMTVAPARLNASTFRNPFAEGRRS